MIYLELAGLTIIVLGIFIAVWVLCRIRQDEDARMDERIAAIRRGKGVMR